MTKIVASEYYTQVVFEDLEHRRPRWRRVIFRAAYALRSKSILSLYSNLLACSVPLRMVREKPLVLVLEDDPVSAEALIMVLRDWGAEVVHATHANHVRRALGARVSELHSIIADYDLGDGPNGVAIAASLLVDAQHARVLVLSGTLRVRSDVAARNAGFDMMQKPARANAIVAWLEMA